MPRRRLPDLYACPGCNVVLLDAEPCGCPNQLQIRVTGKGEYSYTARRWGPAVVREAKDVEVHAYEGPIILPIAERA